MTDALERHAERLYSVFADLVREYQFRDRDAICCHGLSVSQCYSLDALDTQGPMTMGELAGHLHLEGSTMTRLVNGLVADKLVNRVADAKDRRICRARITGKGRSLVRKIRGELIQEHEAVLREIPSESREAVVSAMSRLLSAFRERCRRTSAEADVRCGGRRTAG